MPAGAPVTVTVLLDGIDAAGIAGIDQAVAADLRNAADRSARCRAERHDAAPSGRAAPACRSRSRSVRRPSPRPSLSRGARTATERHRRRPAACAAARGDEAGFAENRHIDEDGVALGAKPRSPPSRSGECQAARIVVGPSRANRPVSARRNATGGRQDQRAAAIVAPLPRENVGVERMMQHERAAGEQPRHQRQANAGKRSRRDGRKDGRVLRKPAFQQDAQAAGQQFEMAPRDRHRAVLADIER